MKYLYTKGDEHEWSKAITKSDRNVVAIAFIALSCFLGQPATTAAQQWNNNSNNINNTNSGNVGINTTNPTARLHVFEPAGNGVSARVTIQDADSSAGFNLLSWNRSWSFVTDNSPFDGLSISSTGGANFFIGNTGNVGIGTSSPDSRLQLHHSSSNTNLGNIQVGDLGLAMRNTNSTSGNMTLISFQDAAGWGNAQFGAIQSDQTNHSAHLVFFTRNGATFGERMRITIGFIIYDSGKYTPYDQNGVLFDVNSRTNGVDTNDMTRCL